MELLFYLIRLEGLVSINIVRDQENLFQTEFDTNDQEIKIFSGNLQVK